MIIIGKHKRFQISARPHLKRIRLFEEEQQGDHTHKIFNLKFNWKTWKQSTKFFKILEHLYNCHPDLEWGDHSTGGILWGDNCAGGILWGDNCTGDNL